MAGEYDRDLQMRCAVQACSRREFQLDSVHTPLAGLTIFSLQAMERLSGRELRDSVEVTEIMASRRGSRQPTPVYPGQSSLIHTKTPLSNPVVLQSRQTMALSCPAISMIILSAVFTILSGICHCISRFRTMKWTAG